MDLKHKQTTKNKQRFVSTIRKANENLAYAPTTCPSNQLTYITIDRNWKIKLQLMCWCIIKTH